MNRALRWITLTMSVCILGIAGSLSQGNGSLEGLVVDAKTNAPLEGVSVAIQSPIGGAPVRRVTSDAQGRFAADDLTPGVYQIVPARTGFLYWRPGRSLRPSEPGPSLRLSSGSPRRMVEVRMAPEAIVTGRVLYATGEPLVNLYVQLLHRTYSRFGTWQLEEVPGIRAAKINDQGNYRFAELYQGDYYLRLAGAPVGPTPSTYYPGTVDATKAQVVHAEMGETLDVGLLAVLRQETRQTRLQLKGSTINATTGRIYVGDLMIGSRVSNGTEMILSQLALGRHEFLLSLQSFTELVFGRVSIEPQNGGDYEVLLAPGIHVSGTASSESGSRVEKVRCTLHSEPDFRPYVTISSSRCIDQLTVAGSYQLEVEGLGPDEYVAGVTANGIRVNGGIIPIDRDVTLDVSIATDGGVVAGTVHDASGTRVAGATVVLVPDSPFQTEGLRYKAVTSSIDGEFEVRGIAPGTYHVFAWSELLGAAYRNAEFMARFQNRGTAVDVKQSAKVSLELRLLALDLDDVPR